MLRCTACSGRQRVGDLRPEVRASAEALGVTVQSMRDGLGCRCGLGDVDHQLVAVRTQQSAASIAVGRFGEQCGELDISPPAIPALQVA